jgi:hypothetical protein
LKLFSSKQGTHEEKVRHVLDAAGALGVPDTEIGIASNKAGENAIGQGKIDAMSGERCAAQNALNDADSQTIGRAGRAIK